MGQEITLTHFGELDFAEFRLKLEQETRLLEKFIAENKLSSHKPTVGFEIEAWLVDNAMRPAPVNQHFLTTLNDPLASPELAKFNIELNSDPLPLTGNVFKQMHRQLQTIWDKVSQHARKMNYNALMIGILPTLEQMDLTLDNMSEMHRYKALNEQILSARGRPVHIDINGMEHLKFDHDDVMLESATTSFQLHTQLPLAIAHHYYNASIIASAAMAAVCANSPFLLGKQLWHETRIPLFEQAIETGGYDGAAHGPLRRVSFGSDYARHSISECFNENLAHFPVLLPVVQAMEVDKFAHLRLHNGTIWRWNRPLIGFDEDGTPHIRVEQRTPAAGPTVTDAIANAVFFYGLAWSLTDEIIAGGLPLSFAQAKDNFYQAAHHGLDGVIVWFDGNKHRLDQIVLSELLPRARRGLESLAVIQSDIDAYLDIIRARTETKQTGTAWQCQYMKNRDRDFAALTRQYLHNQMSGNPVHEWQLT
jgi:gamma-glutamyl:cysteine ligase YbdK (ATP-grasp superfamily)